MCPQLLAFHTPFSFSRSHRRRLRSSVGPVCTLSSSSSSSSSSLSSFDKDSAYDAIIIGSGLGGLCTAALLSSVGRRVLVLESHSRLGGAAHSFTRSTPYGVFKFESGPHLFSGLSPSRLSRNPLRDVLLAVGISNLPVHVYSSWGVSINDAKTKSIPVLKSRPFLDGLLSPHGAYEMEHLLRVMEPLGDIATSISPAILRLHGSLGDALKIALPRLFKQIPLLVKAGPRAMALNQPFANILDTHVTDEFTRAFVNLLCFLLAGVEAHRIPTAEMAFMFHEWRPTSSATDNMSSDCVLEHPVGGASAIVEALAHAIRTSGTKSEIRVNSHVQSILLSDNDDDDDDNNNRKACGVQLKSGVIFNSSTVISNASIEDTFQMFPKPFHYVSPQIVQENCDSFMHLHLALPVSIIPSHISLLPNYIVLRDFPSSPVTHPGNIVLVSIPSVIDSSYTPTPDFHVIHAYLPATEPYAPWQSGTVSKTERAAPLWNAICTILELPKECVEKHAVVNLVGTPLTHARYLRRAQGSYGPKVDARNPGPSAGLPYPGRVAGMPDGVHLVGDAVFPGVGVPAVAGGALIVANSIVSIEEQEEILRRIEI